MILNLNLRPREYFTVVSGLTAGRHSHNMMVEDGRLRVLGGSQGGDKYLRDMETFDGKRWDQLCSSHIVSITNTLNSLHANAAGLGKIYF